VPKLDDKIKEQIKKAEKNPHFGSEKFLIKFQEQSLEIAGPLTCLWANMLNCNATLKQEDILFLFYRESWCSLGSFALNHSEVSTKTCQSSPSAIRRSGVKERRKK